MNRIENTFQELQQKGQKALVGFVTAGDPSYLASLDLITAMCGAGVDILELGMPFSDPTADGPVIQKASARALTAGMSVKKVLEMVRQLRETVTVPIVLFGYYNPILSYGPENFYEDALGAGADGVLIVDLPPEESRELTERWPGNALHLIRLIAPTTPAERMGTIADSASGFVYLVSKTGVTGSDGLDTSTVGQKMDTLRALTQLPICVGFGIKTAQDVAAVAAIADGVVIGTAFEQLIEENLDRPDLPQIMAERVAQYKQATVMG